METITKSSWPPAYNVRLSKKARHVHLKVIPHEGLEVVVPVKQQKRVVIADVLAEKKSWIEKHLAKITIGKVEAISNINLQAINQNWQIVYQPTASKQIRAAVEYGDDNLHTLILTGNVQDIPHVQRWFKKWLTQQAENHLVPWLYALSIEHGLPYNKAAVRAQRTMWGSCTSGKNISLNYKLLFLPAKYAEHVMLHELCHTKHLNHSNKFWQLLTRLDSDCDTHNDAIREADKYIPLFLSKI